MEKFDITIIGAGPAGATLAKLLERKDYNVLLVDRRDFKINSKLMKSCGGLIAPDAGKIMAKLGLGIPKSILVGPQLFSVKVLDLDNNCSAFYQRNYLNLDRQKFDSWLVSKLIRTQKLFNSNLVKINKNDQSYNLKIIKANNIINIKTKILVGADGANSIVRKYIKNNKNLNNYYISLQKWYRAKNNLPYFLSVFDREITDFYSWIIPKDRHYIVGTMVPYRENLRKKFHILENKLNQNSYMINSKVEKSESTFIFRPKKLSDIELGKNNIALIGEAAGFISPSSAEGISYAMKSAKSLYEAIDKDIYNFQQIYFKNTTYLRANIIFKRLKSPFMYSKKLRNMVIKSKILSIG